MNTLPRFLSNLLLEGIMFSLFGILMIISPFQSSLVIELMMGFVILVGGIIQMVESLRLYKIDIPAWPFSLAGLLAIIIGILLIFYPFSGLKVMASLIVIYFAVKAILEFIAAIILKMGSYSPWLIANSLILSLLIVYIWKNWSILSLMLLGLLIGINLLTSGITRIMLGTAGKSLIEQGI